MWVMLVGLSAALPLGAEAPQPLSVRATGTARLVCDSKWHKLDMPLQVKGARVARPDFARVFAPPAAAKEWELRDADVLALVSALHDVPWDAGARDAAYARWRGSGPTGRTLTAKGAIKVTRAGDRLDFTGTVRVTDAGTLADRFGPNGWRDEWEHRIEGHARVDADGRVVSVELRDEFKVAGVFANAGSKDEDRSTRSGTVRLTATRPKPLSAQEVARFQRLLQQLGDDEFERREEATAGLVAWGRDDERVSDLLRAAAGAQTDPEVVYRLKVIRRGLPDKE